MKTPTPSQIVSIVGALVVGVLLDRLVLATGVPPSFDTAKGNSRAQENARGSAGGAASKLSPISIIADTGPTTADKAGTERKALDAILAERDPSQRSRDLQAYINGLGTGEFADALKRVREIGGTNERELASRLLVARWVQTDPEGALQFAAANRGYEYLAEDVFQQRAAVDFQSALSQAQEIPGNDLRYRALRGVLSFRADSDPTGAIQLAQTLGGFPGNEPLSNVLYRQWAATDPQTAAAYAAQQGQAEGWRSPVAQVVNTWADHDPTAAANWALSLADSETQARSLAQVMRDWGRQDPTSTANWIHALPTGAQRDNAVAGFAQSMASNDPQTALGWIQTMTDDAAKQRALQRVSREVMASDPQNGATLLQSAGLPADQIRQGPQGRRGRGR